MDVPQPYYREILLSALQSRIDRNSRYSLRAFGKLLGIDAGAVSQILSGRRRISIRLVSRICSALELDPSSERAFARSVLEEKQSLGLSRISKRLRAVPRGDVGVPEGNIDLQQFRIISEWYYYAILELTHAVDFDPSPKQIAARLGISVTETKMAIQRLIQLGFLISEAGTLRKAKLQFNLQGSNQSTSHKRRRFRQILERSSQSLDVVPIDRRDHSAVTMCVDPANLGIAKERIQKFLWEMSDVLTSGTPKDVYELTVQMFPLERIEL